MPCDKSRTILEFCMHGMNDLKTPNFAVIYLKTVILNYVIRDL